MPDVGNQPRSVVVGAAGTLGWAICRAFLSSGANVCGLDVKSPPEEVSDVQWIRADVTSDASLEEAAALVWSSGPVDSVVYAAGTIALGEVTCLNWSDYRRIMDVNLDGAFRVARTFGRRMIDALQTTTSSTQPTFVFISSIGGKRGAAYGSAYSASKFGVIGLTQSFAAEMAGYGIRVNAVCPGNVDSPMLRQVAEEVAKIRNERADDLMAHYEASALLHRLVDPDEIASTVLWLTSPASSAVTGSAIDVDAGALRSA